MAISASARTLILIKIVIYFLKAHFAMAYYVFVKTQTLIRCVLIYHSPKCVFLNGVNVKTHGLMRIALILKEVVNVAEANAGTIRICLTMSVFGLNEEDIAKLRIAIAILKIILLYN
jgi:hypothetical protein